MTKWGFIGLIALPVLEITLFVVIGGAIGVLATLAVIMATFFLGVAVLQRQNRPPVARDDALVFVAHQILMFFAAVCLILPGFFTDFLGLLLLIRPLRRLIIRLVNLNGIAKFGDFAKRGGMRPQDDILEGDYVDVTPARSSGAVENQDH